MEGKCTERSLLLVDSSLIQKHNTCVDQCSKQVCILVLMVLENSQIEVQDWLWVSSGLDYLLKDRFYIVLKFLHVPLLCRYLALNCRSSFNIDLNESPGWILFRRELGFGWPLEMRDNLHLIHKQVLNHQIRVHHVMHYIEWAQLRWFLSNLDFSIIYPCFFTDKVDRYLKFFKLVGLALFV